MSLALALWLILFVGLVAYRAGRRRGRNEMAAETVELLAPMLPMLKQVSEMAESLGAELGREDATNAMREAGPWN